MTLKTDELSVTDGMWTTTQHSEDVTERRDRQPARLVSEVVTLVVRDIVVQGITCTMSVCLSVCLSVCDSGLRRHLLPLISSAVENEVHVQWKFDEFFPLCEQLSQRLDVTVYSLVTAEYYHCYVNRDDTYVIAQV